VLAPALPHGLPCTHPLIPGGRGGAGRNAPRARRDGRQHDHALLRALLGARPSRRKDTPSPPATHPTTSLLSPESCAQRASPRPAPSSRGGSSASRLARRRARRADTAPAAMPPAPAPVRRAQRCNGCGRGRGRCRARRAGRSGCSGAQCSCTGSTSPPKASRSRDPWPRRGPASSRGGASATLSKR